MPYKKYAKLLVVAVALIIVTVMIVSSFSGLNATSIITVTNNQNGDRHGNDQGAQNYQTGLQSVTLTPTTSVMYTGQPITFVGNWTGRGKSDRSESIRLGQIECTSSTGLV